LAEKNEEIDRLADVHDAGDIYDSSGEAGSEYRAGIESSRLAGFDDSVYFLLFKRVRKGRSL